MHYHGNQRGVRLKVLRGHTIFNSEAVLLQQKPWNQRSDDTLSVIYKCKDNLHWTMIWQLQVHIYMHTHTHTHTHTQTHTHRHTRAPISLKLLMFVHVAII